MKLIAKNWIIWTTKQKHIVYKYLKQEKRAVHIRIDVETGIRLTQHSEPLKLTNEYNKKHPLSLVVNLENKIQTITITTRSQMKIFIS